MSSPLAVLSLVQVLARAQSAPADSTLVNAALVGQSVIRAAIEAGGGQRALSSMRAVEFWLDGDSFNPVQGRNPSEIDRPSRDGRFRVRSVIDLASGRAYQEQLQDLPGGFDFHFSTIVAGGRQHNVGHRDRTIVSQALSPGTPGAPLADGTARYFPTLLLRRASQTVNSARWIEARAVDGRTLDVVDYSWDERTRHRLEIDRETREVRRMRLVTTDPLAPLIEAVYEYHGRRRVGALVIPDSVRVTRRGLVALDLEVRDVRLDAEIDSSVFTPPNGYTAIPFAAAPVTSEPAARLFQIAGLGGGAYRSFFLSTDSGVVLFDPLLGAPVTNAVLAEIAKVAGTAPVRAVIVSHFHADHAGGIAAALATGATIYAPRGSETVIARYAAVTTGQAAGTIASRIIGIGPGASVLLDARRGLRVTNLGPNPHVDGVLVLEDSVSRTIVNADMYSPLSPFNETFAWFVDWAAGRKVAPDLIVGSHHEPIRFDSLRTLRATYRRTRPSGLH